MKWTKQQKILSGVMIAGLLAVGADRLMPRTSSADAAMLADSAEFAIVKAPTALAPAVKTVSLSDRLQAVTSDAPAARGAFELGSAWQMPQTIAAPVVDTAIEAFTNAHKLTLTVAHGERGGAVVDSKLCLIGQSIEGFRLLTVSGRSATFSNGRARVTLTLASR